MHGLVDIGANLTNKAFRGDLAVVLARAARAGVADIVVTGTSAEVSAQAREMVVEWRRLAAPRLHATAGIHPHHASSASPEVLSEIRELAARPEVVAIGECGLDYNRNLSPKDAQLRCFEAQLELAADIGKPVFLHEREAHHDVASLVERYRARLVGGVLHCFTGTRAEVERYLAMGLYVGFTGWLCDERRGTHLRELVREVPAGRLLVETDAPYLLPRDLPDHPTNGRNEPAFLAHIASTVAACRGESLADLALHTSSAASALFRFPPP